LLSAFRSIWIWISTITLIALWLPLMALSRLFDRDPALYRTGFLFRRLGKAMTQVNPSWRIHVSGVTIADPRKPYVVVSNHQSMADIPIISNLPWEMKWMTKVELFGTPLIGWMLKLAGDIAVDRKDRRKAAQAFMQAASYLQKKCSVMFFPEGTRSLDGRVLPFHEGAFHLAIKQQVPILPIVVEGSRDCLPKKSWRFGPPRDIQLTVLSPIDTTGLTTGRSKELTERVRAMIIGEIARQRSRSVEEVDSMITPHDDVA
jgi:1-acyl-sn-glycerol-3-phosphate acyltransferase